MDIREKLERVMLAITFAEEGKHEWAEKILSELDENRRHMERTILGDKLSAIEFYLQLLCKWSVKIEKKKFFSTEHRLILIKNLTGPVRHHLIFASQFLAQNTAVEIIEKLTNWHLEDVLRKTGKNVVLVNDEGLYVPCLGRLNL